MPVAVAAVGLLALLLPMHLRCQPIPPPPTVAVAPTPTPPVAQTPVDQVGGLEQATVDLTNAHRAANGLPALRIDYRLTNAAQSHANDLANTQTLSHDSSYGAHPGDRITAQGYVWSMWAENAASGFDTVDAVMAGWIGSPGHNVNLLNVNVRDIGVAAARGTNGVTYWVMDMAAQR